jgi:hypothetical protein
MQNQSNTLNGLIMAGGAWLIIAPLISSFETTAFWNSLIVGAALILLAGIRLWGNEAKTGWANWINILAGLWLVASPFILGIARSDFAFWNTIVVGIIIIGLAAWSAGEAAAEPRLHRSL